MARQAVVTEGGSRSGHLSLPWHILLCWLWVKVGSDSSLAPGYKGTAKGKLCGAQRVQTTPSQFHSPKTQSRKKELNYLVSQDLVLIWVDSSRRMQRYFKAWAYMLFKALRYREAESMYIRWDTDTERLRQSCKWTGRDISQSSMWLWLESVSGFADVFLHMLIFL